MNKISESIKWLFSCMKVYNNFKFVKQNRVIRDKKERIYIYEAYTASAFCALIPLMLTAKGMQDATGYKVVQIASRKKRMLDSLAFAFGFARRFPVYVDVDMVRRYIKRKKLTDYIIDNYSGDSILDFKYKGCHIGAYIYDSILSKTGRLTIDKFERETDWRIVYSALKLMDEMDRYFSTNPPAYVLAPESAYESGVFIQIAQKHGAKIIINEWMRLTFFAEEEKTTFNEYMRRDISKLYFEIGRTDYISRVKNHFQTLYDGKGSIVWENRAFLGKISEKEGCIKRLGIDKEKPTVFIMAHCMGDAPHDQCPMIYKDFYVWLKRTIEIVSIIGNTNWIVKPHPHREDFRGEDEVVPYLVKTYGKGNVSIYPDDLSASILYEIADCIVTVAGTSGVEYPANGIPCIVCGSPWYIQNGFTIEPQNEEEYVKILNKISSIHKLDEEKINCARVAFASFLDFLEANRKDDKLSRIFYMAYDQIAYNKDKVANDYDGVNEYVMREMADKFDLSSMKESYYYSEGVLCGSK